MSCTTLTEEQEYAYENKLAVLSEVDYKYPSPQDEVCLPTLVYSTERKIDGVPIIVLCQRNADREEDDDFVALTRAEFLRIAKQLEGH